MKKLVIIVLFFSQAVFAQVVYEPLHRDIYSFFSRLSQKSILEFDDQIRPLNRKYLAEKLIEASDKSDQLTSIEIEELDFYKKDFAREIDLLQDVGVDSIHLTYISKDYGDRLRLFSYRDDLFTLNVSPILGGEFGIRDGEKFSHTWNGIYFYGYFGNRVGFSFDFRDNTEKGNTVDKFRNFTSKTGFHQRTDNNIVNYPKDQIEYSEVKTVIGTDWDWGAFSVGKDFMEWGYGESGLLVLSQKAPTFPFIRLDIKPVDWLTFNYFHAFLSSDIVDSSEIYYEGLGNPRIIYREKYLASHTLTIKPISGLNLSFGESIVYSDRFEFSYLFPLVFFRVNDHHLSRQNNQAGSNSQFFFSVSSRGHLKNTHLYGTLFIDEITLSGLFDTQKQRNQIGFAFGTSVTDLPIDNLTLKLEYTKIYPFVYKHYIQTTSYQNASYNLGHWMGGNADQVYGSLNYRFLRGLQATLWAQYIRKGDEGTYEQQYEIQPQPPFLFGLRNNYTFFGATVKYEIVHELIARLSFQTTKSSAQLTDLSFIDKTLNEFYFAVYYGL